MSDEAEVVVATNAFGMGVDKADVRTVAHATVPSSLEAYYQEAGRGGRDGKPAKALLFASQRDKGLHVFFIERARLDDNAYGAVARVIERAAEEDGRYDVGMAELMRVAGPRDPRGGDDNVRAVLGHLVRAGVIRPTPSPHDRAVGTLVAPCDGRAIAICRTAASETEKARWREYRTMWRYVEEGACRRATILRHFGDLSDPAPSGPCCDVCDPDGVLPMAPPEVVPRVSATRAANGSDGAPVGDLEGAILDIVVSASPSVGRTRAVEILRGGRSKVIRNHAYDGLPGYGAYSHLTKDEVLRRVDAMLASGTLRSTGGKFPKLVQA